jgi:hypothetical protein
MTEIVLLLAGVVIGALGFVLYALRKQSSTAFDGKLLCKELSSIREQISPLRNELSHFRGEISALMERVSRLSESINQLSPKLLAPKSPELQPKVETEPNPEPVKTPSTATAAGRKQDVLAEYHDSRRKKNLWMEFENRYSCERFACTNVREHADRPDVPLRFETSSGGAYLAARVDSPGRFMVFPFFAANPSQLRRDGAMDEVFDFPENVGSASFQVAEPAIFTRRRQEWFLKSKGRLEE